MKLSTGCSCCACMLTSAWPVLLGALARIVRQTAWQASTHHKRPRMAFLEAQQGEECSLHSVPTYLQEGLVRGV